MTNKDRLQTLLNGGIPDPAILLPEKFEEIVVPYMTELVEYVHQLGKKLIIHSDGCLTPILDQIHKTGIDGYQSQATARAEKLHGLFPAMDGLERAPGNDGCRNK